MAIVVPIVSEWDGRGIERSIRDIEKAEGGWAKTGAAIKSLQGPALAVGAAFTAGAAVAVNAASNLAESTNAVNKTFGAAADTIKDFGRQSAQAVGLSQREFQSLATSTGSLLTNMGQGQAEAADNTLLLAKRAADMASVFNTDVATALEAVNAGLRGESEPLRAFGVQLSDAALKAKAMELGLYSGKGALDASAKAAATQALILEQTNNIAGDFADTQDGMANSSRSAKAQIEDLAAAFGEQLLPYVEAGIGLLRGLLEWTDRNQSAVTAIIVVVGGFAAAILAANAAMAVYTGAQNVARVATIAWSGAQQAAAVAAKAVTAAQWALNVALTANPIGLVVAAIALLIAGFVLAYKKCEPFREAVDELGRALKNGLRAALDWASDAIAGFVGWLKDAWSWVTNLIGKIGDLVGKLNPLRSLGGLIGRVAATYTVAPASVEQAAAGRAADAPAGGTGPAAVIVTEEQVYQAVARLLMRGQSRHGGRVVLA